MYFNNLKIFFLSICCILNINIFANCVHNNDPSACPRTIFLLEKSTALTSFVDVKITNTGPVTSSIQLRANFTEGSSLCGSNYTLQPRQSITVNLECNINSYPYTLRDADGRSNTLTITEDTSCFGKEPGASCQGGIVIKKCDGTGRIISTNNTDIATTLPNNGLINSVAWGANEIITGANSNTDGQINTNKIINSPFKQFFPAPAFFCANYVSFENGIYYHNWYLPAKDEFNGYKIATISDTLWTSTEYDSTSAYGYNASTSGGSSVGPFNKSYNTTADVICMKKC